MAQGAKKTASTRPRKTLDPYKVELAGRIARAFKQFNTDADPGTEIGQIEFGRRVAAKLKSSKPFAQATVSGWMNVSNPSTPDNPTLLAIAEVLRCDAFWLVFGAREG